MHTFKLQSRTSVSTGVAVLALTLVLPGTMPAIAHAAPASPAAFASPALATVAGPGEEAGSLEAAASKAGETGRKVAMSLIALGFAVASIVLAFRRDFKEAVGVFAVGLVAIILATPAGVNVLHDTVNSLFGSST
jgi:hypothetical protein